MTKTDGNNFKNDHKIPVRSIVTIALHYAKIDDNSISNLKNTTKLYVNMRHMILKFITEQITQKFNKIAMTSYYFDTLVQEQG